jgi:hypothetical protein
VAEDRSMRHRHGVRLLIWWPALFALWLLFAGEWSWLIGVWGAAMASLATVSTGVVARQGLLDVRGRVGWCRELGPAAVAVVVDFGILTWVLVTALLRRRRETGVFLEDRSTAGDGPLEAGRRTWVTLVATWSPNCYVVDIDPKSGRRMIHDLHPHRASELPA